VVEKKKGRRPDEEAGVRRGKLILFRLKGGDQKMAKIT